ncbi:MAG: hypothetical protein ACMUJM_24935 [bacterium]
MVKSEAPADGESRRQQLIPIPKASAPRFYSTVLTGDLKRNIHYTVQMYSIKREK